MKIAILTGGTGSIALQVGLYNLIERRFDGVDTKIIVNAYDNGLSTGVVRRVMDGRILGPSDVRKNHATRLGLLDPNSPWLTLLNNRFTVETPKAKAFCISATDALLKELRDSGPVDVVQDVLIGAVEEFFNAPSARVIVYEDFSLANIIYAGLARRNGNSLRAAATLMANAMGISDNVLVNDDESLYLGAITRSGRVVTDEGEIVTWCNETDPFVDVCFTDAMGNKAVPRLCLEAWNAIVQADLIILSCGTQWSSLIPTYASEGFRAAMSQSAARVLMIMNRVPDKDAPSQSASDIVKAIVPRFFGLNRLHVIADQNGDPQMRELEGSALSIVASFTQSRLSIPSTAARKYDSQFLAEAVSETFFRDHLDSDFYLFDYDDTLVGRKGRYPASSQFNVGALARLNSLADIAICTGNNGGAVNLRVGPAEAAAPDRPGKRLLVFADGGVNKYLYDSRPAIEDESTRLRFLECIAPGALLQSSGPYRAGLLMDVLRRARIPLARIENRGNAVLAIKPVPVSYREAVLSMLRHIIEGFGLEIRETGTTTVEICKPSLSKLCAVHHVRSNLPKSSIITYVGDECNSGNDRDIYALSVEDEALRCLHVSSPAKTAFFIDTLTRHLLNAKC